MRFFRYTVPLDTRAYRENISNISLEEMHLSVIRWWGRAMISCAHAGLPSIIRSPLLDYSMTKSSCCLVARAADREDVIILCAHASCSSPLAWWCFGRAAAATAGGAEGEEGRGRGTLARCVCSRYADFPLTPGDSAPQRYDSPLPSVVSSRNRTANHQFPASLPAAKDVCNVFDNDFWQNRDREMILVFGSTC